MLLKTMLQLDWEERHLYKTHKTGMPVRLLTSKCNTRIENLSLLIEIICFPLTEVMQCCIKTTSHLLDIIDN